MQSNKIFHILSYIPPLFIISLFIDQKDSPAVRFHCHQGLILTLFVAVTRILVSMLGFFLGWVPFLGDVAVHVISAVFGVASLALMVIGILNAVNDREDPLPIIGRLF